jgi:hypothetical protein
MRQQQAREHRGDLNKVKRHACVERHLARNLAEDDEGPEAGKSRKGTSKRTVMAASSSSSSYRIYFIVDG